MHNIQFWRESYTFYRLFGVRFLPLSSSSSSPPPQPSSSSSLVIVVCGAVCYYFYFISSWHKQYAEQFWCVSRAVYTRSEVQCDGVLPTHDGCCQTSTIIIIVISTIDVFKWCKRIRKITFWSFSVLCPIAANSSREYLLFPREHLIHIRRKQGFAHFPYFGRRYRNGRRNNYRK